MPTLVFDATRPKREDPAAFDMYLEAAAKIVETVAYEMATRASASTVEELMGIACRIEKAAGRIRPAD
ncbi:hypothetical protein K3757_04230 [Sulfitobacter sp. S223]|uniref:hypothetical protein n=1 Tax=Sulfitobacter sp. S223 TaxID=2867023 RepID=UPI0021A7C435|nr:hypothetical protein [Sulfitobacter sp. S223]UWR27157.1 hypothetical protein K3757_04230 [Sulfitobacter sp. S223]